MTLRPLLLAAFFLSSCFWTVAAKTSAWAAGPVKLLYYGGDVVSKIKFYAVYWGPNVNSEVQGTIPNFLKSLSNSTYIDALSQYDTNIKAVNGNPGSDQKIVRGTFAGATTIVPKNKATTLTEKAIAKELNGQFKANALKLPDPNSVYIVFFPPNISISANGGASCTNFCGVNSFAKDWNGNPFFYEALPDFTSGACSTSCGSGAMLDNMTNAVSRYALTAITNPYTVITKHGLAGEAWETKTGAFLGDMCVSGQAGLNATLTAGTNTYNVDQVFDNATHECLPGPFQNP